MVRPDKRMVQLLSGSGHSWILCVCNFWVSFVILVDGKSNETAFLDGVRRQSGLLHRETEGDASTKAASRQNVTSFNETTNNTKKIEEEIVVGVLIPYTSKVAMSSHQTGYYYASSFLIARDNINSDTNLLPGRKVRIIFNDTECLDKNEIQQFDYQLNQMNAVAIIGLGCDGCEAVARFAGALNIPIISHVSRLLVISSIEFKFVLTTKYHQI